MSTFDLESLSDQDLIDYLYTATKEDDALFVVYWLQALRDRSVDSPSLRTHSWKTWCSLTIAVSRSHSPTRQFILELLLARTNPLVKWGLGGWHHAVRHCQEWTRPCIAFWLGGSPSIANDAQTILAMSPDDAERCLTKIVPAPDESVVFTGFSPLPSRPVVSASASNNPFEPAPSVPRATVNNDTIRQDSPASDVIPMSTPTPPWRLNPNPLTSTVLARKEQWLRINFVTLGGLDNADVLAAVARFGVPLRSASIHRNQPPGGILLFKAASIEEMRYIISRLNGVTFLGYPIDLDRAFPPAHLRVLPNFFHVVVCDVPTIATAQQFSQYLSRSDLRCGAFDISTGYLGHNHVGVFRVETQDAAEEAVEWLQAKGFHRSTWGWDPRPTLSRTPPSSDSDPQNVGIQTQQAQFSSSSPLSLPSVAAHSSPTLYVRSSPRTSVTSDRSSSIDSNSTSPTLFFETEKTKIDRLNNSSLERSSSVSSSSFNTTFSSPTPQPLENHNLSSDSLPKDSIPLSNASEPDQPLFSFPYPFSS